MTVFLSAVARGVIPPSRITVLMLTKAIYLIASRKNPKKHVGNRTASCHHSKDEVCLSCPQKSFPTNTQSRIITSRHCFHLGTSFGAFSVKNLAFIIVYLDIMKFITDKNTYTKHYDGKGKCRFRNLKESKPGCPSSLILIPNQH